MHWVGCNLLNMGSDVLLLVVTEPVMCLSSVRACVRVCVCVHAYVANRMFSGALASCVPDMAPSMACRPVQLLPQGPDDSCW